MKRPEKIKQAFDDLLPFDVKGFSFKRLTHLIPHKPYILLLGILVWVYLAEMVIMQFLQILSIQNSFLEGVVDASILLLFCIPAGYLFLYRPLIEQVNFLTEERMGRKLLADTIDQSSDVVVITDQDGTINYVNKAFEVITGYSREEAIGKTPRILKSGKQDQKYYNHMWETISSGKIWEGHLINKKKDGTLFEEDAIISPVFDSSKNITNFIAVKRDMTERVFLEKQLLQSQKMEAIGTLAGGIAHEFNNIMTPILGYTELMLKTGKPNTEHAKYLEIIRNGAERAKGLVAQVLEFGRRKEEGRHILDLKPLIKEVLNLLHSTLPSNITITKNISPQLGMVEANATQIHTVFINLCINARDAMPQGGELFVSLKKVDLQPGNKDYRKGHTGSYVCLTVKDNGTGMEEETKSKIFDPFFTTKEVGRGTGLGLSTAYGIIEQHGGFIDVTSALGRGSTFRIFLPEKFTPINVEPVNISDELQGTESILLIDDEREILHFGESVLTDMGFQVTCAENGEEALKILESEKGKEIDLIISDLTMPGITGEKLLRKIKNIFPQIPIILSSGYSQSQDMEVLKNLGVKEILMKPYSISELTKTIQQALGKS